MIDINLLPPHIKSKKRELPTKAITIIIILITYTFMGISFAWLNRTEKTEKQKINELEREVKKYRLIEKKINNLKEEQKELKLEIKLITKLLKDNPTIIQTIDTIVKSIPKDEIFLDNIKCNLTSVKIVGNSVSLDSIAKYINNLEKTKKFTSVSLEGTKTRKIENNSFINFTLIIKK